MNINNNYQDLPDMFWYSKEDWPEEMSLSSHKEWETGLWDECGMPRQELHSRGNYRVL
jgi:hypothetical protein